MADWLEHSVQVEVEAPMDLVWSLWSDLEQMPQWMNWIDSVKIPPDNPEISIWSLRTGAWEFNWRSRILKQIPNQIIEWESVDGLPNRGAIRFYDRKTTSIVKLTVAYSIPGVIGKIMDGLFIGKAVETSLTNSLNRFRTYAEARVAEDS
jgi:uncharacterized membrane protein